MSKKYVTRQPIVQLVRREHHLIRRTFDLDESRSRNAEFLQLQSSTQQKSIGTKRIGRIPLRCAMRRLA